MVSKYNNKFLFFKGRVALYALLKAMGVGGGDEVIMPGFTCVVVPNAVLYLNAAPVYVDIDKGSFNIDPEKVEEKITDKTKVLIVQHTFGIPADMDKLLDIAKRYNLYVIEDCCHAIGSRYRGREVGSFGDAAFFSSQWSKPVTTGLGGWAVVKSSAVKERLAELYCGLHSEFSVPSVTESFLMRIQYAAYSTLLTPEIFWFARAAYRAVSGLGLAVGSSTGEELLSPEKMPAGYRKKMTPWQARLLERKLAPAAINELIRHRRQAASRYRELLGESGFKTVDIPDSCDPVLLYYPVLVSNKEKVLSQARKKKVELSDWFVSPVHPNLDGWGGVGYKKGSCPVAEDMCKRVVGLPTHAKITEKEILAAVGLLKKFAV